MISGLIIFFFVAVLIDQFHFLRRKEFYMFIL